MTLELSKKARHKAARRRSMPIHGYCGENGGGKSLAAVHDSLPSLEAGRPVLSTVRLLDYRDPRPCSGYCDDPAAHWLPDGGVHQKAADGYVPFRDYGQLLDFGGGDVLMDEVTGVASSRESQGLPYQVANFLVQLRRRDIALRWTTPNWRRADTIIREVTGLVTYCNGYMPKERRDSDRIWRDRRLFLWKTYDAAAFEDFTNHQREKLRASTTQLVWRSRSVAQNAYDTLDAVATLGHLDSTGVCMDCNGRRTRHACKCASPASPVRLDVAAPAAGALLVAPDLGPVLVEARAS